MLGMHLRFRDPRRSQVVPKTRDYNANLKIWVAFYTADSEINLALPGLSAFAAV